jgi:hypothetical protein
MQLQHNAKAAGKHSEKKAKMNLVDLAGSDLYLSLTTLGKYHQQMPSACGWHLPSMVTERGGAI